ncbi:MAG: glycosyltransferase family 4 protein [Candidatus Sabulitectum sp.]|nr:glycosyltransferase family 4 protein [Candidatus Sabulitectum sp.]
MRNNYDTNIKNIMNAAITGTQQKTVVLLVLIWRKIGGLEAVNQDIALAFQSLGWRVKVFSVFGTDDDHDSQGFDVTSFCPRNRYCQYLWKRYLWKVVIAWHIHRTLAKGDLLIFGHAHLLPLLDSLPRAAMYKRWAWIYGIDVWGSQAIRWITFLNKLDRVISISSFTAEQVYTTGLICPISIVPCAADTEMFIPTLTPERIRRNEILICGRMAVSEGYKGHQVLFESIPIAEKLLGRFVTVRVVGSGDDQPRLETVAKQLGLSERISFSGRVSSDELVEAYQHCGLFCMPSYVERREIGYWTGEGFGIVYVEAAACGRPVLASTDGGAPETIIPGKTGLLVDPLCPEAIGSAIAEILSDPVRADEMGRQGRLLAESCFSKKEFVYNVSKLFELD